MRRWVLLAAFVLSVSTGWAGQIKWTAAGTVEEVDGEGFSPLVSVADPVEIELSYEDTALKVPVSGVNGIFTKVEFRDEVKIDLRVVIGANTWQGTLASGTPGGIRTIELTDFQIGGVPGDPTYDEFTVTVAASDGGSFPSFPGIASGPQHLMQVRFRDGSESVAGPDYIGSEDLACAAHSWSRITVADGVMAAGSQQVRFRIDPASIVTEIVGARTLAVRRISYADGEVTMSWATVPGRLYLIQFQDAFLCWREVLGIFAEEEETTETFFPVGFPKTQLYRVVELE